MAESEMILTFPEEQHKSMPIANVLRHEPVGIINDDTSRPTIYRQVEISIFFVSVLPVPHDGQFSRC